MPRLKKESKMKISEITINDADLVFETLKSNVATTIANIFLEYRYITKNFSSYPQDVYSIDEITEILYNLKSQMRDASDIFDSSSQTIMLIQALINYFNTGF